jgi:hypothetical protein
MTKSYSRGFIKRFVFCIVVALLSVNSFAGPPYQTDDPEPPEKGHWELYLAAYASAEATGVLGGCPQFEANYGALDNLQLSIAPQMAFSAALQGSRVSAVRYGLGDIELGAKYRFIQENGPCPQIAVYPQVVLPVGDQKRGLGNGMVQVFLPLWAQKSWGPWCMFGGGGYWYNPGTGNKNWAYAGAALQRDLCEAVSVGGELFFHSAAQTDDVNGVGGDLAILWHFTKDDGIVCAAGRDLGIGNTKFMGYLAYQKNF